MNGNSKEVFVTKTKKVLNNAELSNKCHIEMLNEFNIAKDLNHANIVSYKHFVKNELNGADEFHLIIELMEGGCLKQYIK